MTPADLRQVQRIERAAYRDPWPRTVFEQELRNGFARYLVAIETAGDGEDGRGSAGTLTSIRHLLGLGPEPDRIVGFCGVWFAADQLHIATIAVTPGEQRRGIARRMLFECSRLAVDAGMESMVLEVRSSNEGAIRLYETFGFRTEGRRLRYYPDNGEDAIVMALTDLDDAGTRARLRRMEEEHRNRHGDAFDYASRLSAATSPAAPAPPH